MTAEEIVAEIEPVDGWCRGFTEDKLMSVAEDLLDFGSEPEIVLSAMIDIVSAIRGEYGE